MSVKWSGFKDTGSLRIAGYGVKFRGSNIWQGKSIRIPDGDRTYAEVCGLEMSDDQRYSVPVQAANAAGMESDFVEGIFMLDSEEPTAQNGSDVQIAWTTVNEVLTIGWRGLFNSSSPLSYECSVGTNEYGADIIQWQETTDEEIALRIPAGLSAKRYYLTLTAVNSAGLYRTKMWTLIVDELGSFTVS